MTPGFTFLAGISLLALSGWYFATSRARLKRILGTILTVLLVAFCLTTLYPPDKTIRLGLDLQGGTSFLIRLTPEGERSIGPDTLDQAVEVIRKRVDQFGVSEPVITPQGADRILVQIPGLDPEQIAAARQQLAQVAKLEFRLVHPETDRLIAQIREGTNLVPAGYRVETQTETSEGREIQEELLVKVRPDLLGDRVRKAFPTYDEQGWGVALQLDREGANLFGQLTEAHVGKRFAIVLDGKVQSAPVIREPIYGGHASITGDFTEEEVRNLASVLENPLQTPVTVEEERSVSATLGSDSIPERHLRRVGWSRAQFFLHRDLLSICRPSRQRGAGYQSRAALRNHDDVPLCPDATGNSRHHSNDRHGCGRERADLRKASRGTRDR
jgi:SecD/SecF fusion protein